MCKIEISRGLYLTPNRTYEFYAERVMYTGTFIAQESKEFIFKEVVAHLPIAWGAGDTIPTEVGERRFKGEDISELIQKN